MALPSFLCPNCCTETLITTNHLHEEPLLAPHKPTSWLECTSCHSLYPVFDNIYVLWSDDIKRLYSDSSFRFENVKSANIYVYQAIASSYKEHHSSSSSYSKYLKMYLSSLQSVLQVSSSRTLLDVGCSSGELLDLAHNFGFDKTIGVDLSFNNLLLFRNTPHIGILCDAESIPLASDSVDAVSCIATLHHIPNPHSLFTSVSSILKNQSPFLVGGEPTVDSLKRSFFSDFLWSLRKPVYRFLHQFNSSSYILHSDSSFQAVNDLAENHRSAGGFSSSHIISFSYSLLFLSQK